MERRNRPFSITFPSVLLTSMCIMFSFYIIYNYIEISCSFGIQCVHYNKGILFVLEVPINVISVDTYPTILSPIVSPFQRMSLVRDIISILHVPDFRAENGEMENFSKTITESVELHEKIEYDESEGLLSNVAGFQASYMIEKTRKKM